MSYTNLLGQVRVGVRLGVPTITAKLLDTYSGSAASYSLRKLSSTYSGFAIRVRRSSDNGEQNIGFDGDGNLDTTSLLSFVGVGHGFVTTWYDQSGNSKNVTQTTAARQPWIVESGVLLTSNGRPGIKFMSDASGSYFLTGTANRTNTNEAMSMYVVYRLTTLTRQGQFSWGVIDLEPGANSSGIALHQNGSFAYSPNNAAYWSTNLALGSVVFTGGLVTNNTIYYNGVARTSAITNGGNGNMQIGGVINIGKGAYSGAKSIISELILYPNGSQNSNVSSINNNLNSYYSIYPPTVSDTDAQAFINSAYITNSTQANSINTLVIDLKAAGLWTKMKAIYPFVGGSATSHKFNLKDPRDLAAAFALQFLGGMTHTSNGAVPNGSNAYALTSLTTSTALANGSQHLSFYSKTQQGSSGAVEIGAINGGTGVPGTTFALNSTSWNSGTPNYFIARLSGGGYGSYGLTPISDTKGFAILSRTDSNTLNAYWNGTYYGQNAQTSIAVPTPLTLFGRAYNVAGSETYTFSGKTCAFASIGDGLTSTETDSFYMIVQKYQTTLGRQEGTPVTSLTTYDSNALAFLNYAGITDATQRSAVNTLVSSLKTAGVWTKMRAIYPFVGGSATSHKFNLKDPRDMNTSFRLEFSGGWTHSSTGAKPNGVDAFANTFLASRSYLNNDSLHLSFYSRTDVTSTTCDMGGGQTPNYYAAIYPKFNGGGTLGMSISVHDGGVFVANSSSSAAFYLATRNSSTQVAIFRNNLKLSLLNSTRSNNSDMPIILGALNNNGIGTPIPTAYSPREQAFASIGDGLTDADALAFYNAIQAYQTTLGRQV